LSKLGDGKDALNGEKGVMMLLSSGTWKAFKPGGEPRREKDVAENYKALLCVLRGGKGHMRGETDQFPSSSRKSKLCARKRERLREPDATTSHSRKREKGEPLPSSARDFLWRKSD